MNNVLVSCLKKTLLVAFLLMPVLLVAQQSLSWTYKEKSEFNLRASDVYENSDGTILFLNNTFDAFFNTTESNLMVLSKEGELLRSEMLTVNGLPITALKLIKLPSGEFLVVFYRSAGNKSQMGIMKLDAELRFESHEMIDGVFSDSFNIYTNISLGNSMFFTALAVNSNPASEGPFRCFIVKLDSSGKLLGQKQVQELIFGFEIDSLDGDKFSIYGRGESIVSSNLGSSGVVLEMDTSLNVLSYRRAISNASFLTKNRGVHLFHNTLDKNGYKYLSGLCRIESVSSSQTCIYKLDKNDSALVTLVLNGGESIGDYPSGFGDLLQKGDNFWLARTIDVRGEAPPYTPNAIAVTALDTNLNVLWERNFSTGLYLNLYRFVSTNDGGALALANEFNETEDNSPHGSIVIFKLDSLGMITGINSFSKGKLQLLTYPNPTSEQLTVSLPNNTKAYELSIINTLGEEVHQTVFTGLSTINTSTFASGAYFVLLKENGKLVHSEKVVVQH